MSVDLPLLIFGLLLLWFPRQWMRVGGRLGPRRRKTTPSGVKVGEPWKQVEPGDPRLNFRREFTKGRNYVDLLRAGAGGLAIIGGLQIPPSISLDAAGSAVSPWQVLGIKLGIVTIGLLIQTIRYERKHLSFFAPIFYLAGLSVSLCSLTGAMFAFVFIWAINPIFRSPRSFLGLYGIVVAGYGIGFHNVGRILPLAAFLLCFLPVLMSLLARKSLVVFTRRASPATAPGA